MFLRILTAPQLCQRSAVTDYVIDEPVKLTGVFSG